MIFKRSSSTTPSSDIRDKLSKEEEEEEDEENDNEEQEEQEESSKEDCIDVIPTTDPFKDIDDEKTSCLLYNNSLEQEKDDLDTNSIPTVEQQALLDLSNDNNVSICNDDNDSSDKYDVNGTSDISINDEDQNNDNGNRRNKSDKPKRKPCRREPLVLDGVRTTDEVRVQCNMCMRFYSSKKSLDKHMLNKHTTNQVEQHLFPCSKCDSVLPTSKAR